VDRIVQDEWLAAVQDSGLDIEQLRLLEAEGEVTPDSAGQGFYRSPTDQNVPPIPGGNVPEQVLQLFDAPEWEGSSLHLFAIWRENQLPVPVLAALLRHELEHARQWQEHGDRLFRLHEAVMAAPRDLAGARFVNFLFNVAPIEIDANAAAARFVWGRHEAAVQELVDSGYHDLGLFRYRGGPEPIETLPERTICFAHLFAERCERKAAEEGISFTEALEWRWPGAGEFWSRLQGMRLRQP
jgi:hypothetical protein